MKRVIVTLKGSVLQRLQKNHGVAARLVQRSQWPHERVKKKKKIPLVVVELEGGGRLRGAPCSPNTCLRAAPSCTELACKFKCEAQPPIIIISLYCQRCRGGALARREEGSQPQPEPPSQSQRSRSCWERERPQSPPARGSATPPTNPHRPPRGVPRAALGGPGPPKSPSLPRGPPDGSLRSAASAPRRGARGCGRCIVPQLNN